MLKRKDLARKWKGNNFFYKIERYDDNRENNVGKEK